MNKTETGRRMELKPKQNIEPNTSEHRQDQKTQQNKTHKRIEPKLNRTQKPTDNPIE